MQNEVIFQRLNELFRDVFDDSGILVTPETAAADIDGWDSLMHITLMQAIEDEFGVKFAMREIVGLRNAGDIAEIIARRG